MVTPVYKLLSEHWRMYVCRMLFLFSKIFFYGFSYFIIISWFYYKLINYKIMDNHSKEVRSYNMSRIRSIDSKPELLVRKFLHSKWFRYSLYKTDLPGKPDIILSKHKTVIFVNWCFRHCHKWCKYFKTPKSNLSYRIPKLERNLENDKLHHQLLKKIWRRVIIIRECDLKKEKREKTLIKLLKTLYKG